jgi:hypothetical protein
MNSPIPGSAVPAKRPRPSTAGYLTHGELSRRILEGLRDHDTMSAAELADIAVSDKGLDDRARQADLPLPRATRSDGDAQPHPAHRSRQRRALEAGERGLTPRSPSSAILGVVETSRSGTDGAVPKCNYVPTTVNAEPVMIVGDGGQRWVGVAHVCPNCNVILSVGIDLIALKSDIVSEVIDALRRRP